MPSPTSALLWEIWRRHRLLCVVVIAVAVTGRILDGSQQTWATGPDDDVLVELLRMVSFVILFGIFNYTDSDASGELGPFPRRLFTLPVSSLQLVAIPVLAGVCAAEALYLLWTVLPSTAAAGGSVFGAVLVGGLMVLYQATLWTLDRLGPLRLVVVGLEVVLVFGLSLLPSFAPTPPPIWRSERMLTAVVIVLAAAVFVGAWRHLALVRSGGGRHLLRVDAAVTAVTAFIPRRRRGFASPAAAQFWFEWRRSGVVLPVLVAGVLLTVIAPLSWLSRHDADDTLRILIGTLSVPILLAVPVGLGFARPMFWSEDLSIPAFIAVRPLTDEDLVATKVKVAAASAAASWVLLLSFLAIWLLSWANLAAMSRISGQLSAVVGRAAAMYALGGLAVIAGLVLTWRFLVSRLWSGLSGRRSLFVGSAVLLALAVIGGMVLDASRFPAWVLEDRARLTTTVGVAAILAGGKASLAIYSWRHVALRYLRPYLTAWFLATTCCAVLAVAVSEAGRAYVPLDIVGFRAILIVSALLVVPLGRIGCAFSSVRRNRHR